MARTKATLGDGARLTDYLSTSLLARVYPANVIGSLLDAHNCNSKRERSFPATSVVYYGMALSLYPLASYGDVFDAVAQGLAWRERSAMPAAVTLTSASISDARGRLPWAVMQQLQERCCKPLAQLKTCPEAFYKGLRIMAIDGSNFEVPDEADNVACFGYPGSRTGHAGYPQAQCAVLTECATHAIIGANIGAYRDAEWTICKPLLKHLDQSMLCLADRGFNGYEHWTSAKDTGAQLLWRCSGNRQLAVMKALPDGSFLSEIRPSTGPLHKDKRAVAAVRVIEYGLTLADGKQVRYRLLTSLLDEVQAPALELARLYHERWEIEAVFDELKTHLRQSRRVFRSKKPDLVRQEFYGWVMAHYAVRWLMHCAGSEHGMAPRKLSFTGSVSLMKIALPQSGSFPPEQARAAKVLVSRPTGAGGKKALCKQQRQSQSTHAQT